MAIILGLMVLIPSPNKLRVGNPALGEVSQLSRIDQTFSSYGVIHSVLCIDFSPSDFWIQ
ncbi:MAG: hypothetical protein AMJ73_05875 [candidate division Zixibacteria bacterium SM1_73]|nr:MAG: hypothetical protein AMJ73_05875 [candidate division Zixibacteria bacterium SM1_73]